jgi:hypothetical protein
MNPADKEIPNSKLVELFSGEIVYQEAVAYYLDVNISLDLVELLREKGIRVTTAYIEEQHTEKADTYLLARSRELCCVMVTYDKGFVAIHERIIGLEGLAHAGLFVVTSSALREYPSQLAARLIRMAEKYEGWPDLLHGQLIRL